MTASLIATDSATPYAQRLRGKSASIVVLLASFDLMLATLIIIAGSQGVYRFVPPLLLWLMIYAMVGLKFATHLRTLLSVLRNNATLLMFPAVAFVSASWSLGPSHSIYSAVQLTVTYLAGIWLGWRYRPNEIALIMVIALTPLIALSLVNWSTGMFGNVFSYTGGLLGVFGNKNTLGRMSLLLGLAALGLIVNRRSGPMQNASLVVLFAMAVLTLLLSKSATSVIVFLGAFALFVLLTMHSYRAGTRLAIGCVCILAILSGGVLIAFGNFDPVNEILAVFGKSSSLTGRTFLWDTAYRQIAEQPWLGVGYDAYWDSGRFLALDKVQRSYGSGLISFHNFVLDIWVGLGVPGLIAIFVTIGTFAVVYIRYYLVSRSVEAAMMLALLFAAIGVGLFNPLLHNQHGNMIVTLLAFAVSARIEMQGRVDP